MEDQLRLSERLKTFYPKVNVAETPLTTSWNPREKFNYLGLSNNNLRVHYKGGMCEVNVIRF